MYVCVCIYRPICLNPAFLLSLRVLQFPWRQPVPQHRGERGATTAELQLSWRCSFSSFGSRYFHHKGKWFRNWRDAVLRCLGEGDIWQLKHFWHFFLERGDSFLSSLQWSTETLSSKACLSSGQPNSALPLLSLFPLWLSTQQGYSWLVDLSWQYYFFELRSLLKCTDDHFSNHFWIQQLFFPPYLLSFAPADKHTEPLTSSHIS